MKKDKQKEELVGIIQNIKFTGMVRHYFLRKEWAGQIAQVILDEGYHKGEVELDLQEVYNIIRNADGKYIFINGDPYKLAKAICQAKDRVMR